METKIGRVKEFEMFYDSHTRGFIARNAEGEEIASAKTQEDLEKQLDKLAKQKYTFPIKALRYRDPRYIDIGKVTSLNISDQSVWFCEDKEKGDYYSHRGKHNLRYDPGIYELTAKNAEIVKELMELLNGITELEEKMKLKAKLLEKPINLEYFGLESRY